MTQMYNLESQDGPGSYHGSQPFVRRVLMTVDPIQTWDYALTLAFALEKYGLEIGLACMGGRPTAEQRTQVRNSMQVELFESKYKLEWMNNPWRDVAAAGEWLLELEKTYKPDLIHLNHMAFGAIEWQTPVLTTGHVCSCSLQEALKGPKATAPDIERFRGEVRTGLKHSAEVIAPTLAMLLDLKKHYGITRGRVIHSACKGAAVVNNEKEAFVLACGNLADEAKNLKSLAAAAKGLDWPVVIAGEDKKKEAGETTKRENFEMTGVLAHGETLDLMRRAAIFAMPSRCESFGLAALEAGRAGCVLVLSDIPALREIWGHGALYVNPENPRELHETIQRLIRKPELRAEYAARARLRAAQYQPEQMAVGYLHVYNNMLRQHRVPFAKTADDMAERPIRRRRKASRAIVKATY